jgi:hypothetical protein
MIKEYHLCSVGCNTTEVIVREICLKCDFEGKWRQSGTISTGINSATVNKDECSK